MRQTLIILFQILILLSGIMILMIMILFPKIEGRARHLDTLSIYLDPFILYIYASSIPFFIGMYKLFRLLGYIREDRTISQNSVNALRSIKHCAMALSFLVIAAGLYIAAFHHKDDDPAGFLALSFVATFLSVTVAAASAVFEKKIRNRLSIPVN